MMNNLIKHLQELSDDANNQHHMHTGFSDLSEYYLGYSEGINRAIEVFQGYIDEQNLHTFEEEI